MADITQEQQARFDGIVEQIYTALDPTVSNSIITNLKELWGEIKSAESHQ